MPALVTYSDLPGLVSCFDFLASHILVSIFSVLTLKLALVSESNTENEIKIVHKFHPKSIKLTTHKLIEHLENK